MDAGDSFLKISEDEAKIYDRQIRLWGLDAQKRLRAARVLMVGLGGLGSEIAKNIILAGLKSVHFMDDQNVLRKDLKGQIFFRQEDVGTNRAISSLKRAQLLNPMVEVTAESARIDEKSMSFFENYDVICVTSCDWNTLERLDRLCRKNGIKLFAGGAFGFYGYMLSDLCSHDYAVEVIEKKKTQEGGEHVETKTIKKVEEFPPLEEIFSIDWSDEKNALKLKKVPEGFFFCKVISDFILKHGRTPESETQISDKEELLNLKNSNIESLKIDEKCISADFLDGCFGELVATCAVVGGVIGQEIIKAVSKRDLPHNNFFFFSGIDGCGIVHKISSS